MTYWASDHCIYLLVGPKLTTAHHSLFQGSIPATVKSNYSFVDTRGTAATAAAAAAAHLPSGMAPLHQLGDLLCSKIRP
ncbi:hypothetical protein SETIT_7G025500v2 [Setaria italica]|uniref:Uncharacterized protein n=1 Tax=Setaria italica TaxID=4555 RepID=A0A368RRE6_SETIT|nr:hypothetical protein SETIT_7G025500v2 [Setaria italica]RCV32715.1 hypothetical protein SETIT_7G025500v2 [Setaria italica]